VNRTRRWVLAAAAAGFAARLCFALFYWVGQPLTQDERDYLALARSLVQGDGFAYPADEPSQGTSARFDRPPAYPLFLATLGVGTRGDAVPARVKVAQAFVGAIGVWLIGAIACRAWNPRAGVVAAWIAAIYPPLVFLPAYALSETLYSTLALGAARVLDEVAAQPRSRGAVVAGVLLGAAILVRPAMLVFLPLLVWWYRGAPRRRAGAIVLAAALAVVAPWTMRNALVLHRFVPVAAEGGVNFWIGNHPLASGDGDMAANPEVKRAEIRFREAHPGRTPSELEPLYYRAAVDGIIAHPAWWLGLEARKLFYTFVPTGASYRLHSPKYYAASAVSWLVLLPLAAAGGWYGRRSLRPPAALWLMALAAIVSGLIFFPQERYRIPVIDPALIVTAAALAARPR
jgi:hypothetical protein